MTLKDFQGRAQLVAFEEGLQQSKWALFIITPEWKETLCLKYILANLSANEDYLMTDINNADAHHWNTRYQAEGKQWLRHKPKQLLVDYAGLLPTDAKVLDSAAGVGVNALFLAQRGMQVYALDVSWVGLNLAKMRFREQGLVLDSAVVDLSNPWLPSQYFDAVLNISFLERATFPVYQQTLKPGGILIFEAFAGDGEDVAHPDYYLQPNELVAAFSNFEIIHSKRIRRKHRNKKSAVLVEQMVARKPT